MITVFKSVWNQNSQRGEVSAHVTLLCKKIYFIDNYTACGPWHQQRNFYITLLYFSLLIYVSQLRLFTHKPRYENIFYGNYMFLKFCLKHFLKYCLFSELCGKNLKWEHCALCGSWNTNRRGKGVPIYQIVPTNDNFCAGISFTEINFIFSPYSTVLYALALFVSRICVCLKINLLYRNRSLFFIILLVIHVS